MNQGIFPKASARPELHVFEQNNRWHWGITRDREAGTGFKVVAYSNAGFPTGDAAYAAGSEALTWLKMRLEPSEPKS